MSTGDLEVQVGQLRRFDRITWDAERCDQLIRRLEATTDLSFDENERRWPKAPITRWPAPTSDSPSSVSSKRLFRA